MDILETARVQRLTMSPTVVGYLKMLVTLGALRHQLAIDYDLPDTVRRFVRRLARQQGLTWLDPRLALDRLYAGSGRVQRALDFVEFLEAQEPAILEAESSLFGFRNRMQSARRALVRLGGAALAIGALLYVVLAYPDDTRRMLPAGMPIHVGPARPARPADPADRRRWSTSCAGWAGWTEPGAQRPAAGRGRRHRRGCRIVPGKRHHPGGVRCSAGRDRRRRIR